MPKVKAEVLDYRPEDEHLLRRLGCAVVFQWGALPEDAQALVLDQATFMHDREATTQLREQLEEFIEQHKRRR